MYVCTYVCMYVWYLKLSREPRHVAQQARYQNVGLRNGHCLGTISSGATSNQRAARENGKISSAQRKNAREFWQQSSGDGQLTKTANGIAPDWIMPGMPARVQTVAERRRREAVVEQSMKIRSRSCRTLIGLWDGWVSGYHHHHQLVYCSHVHTLDSHIMKNWHRSSQLNSGYQFSTTHQHISNSVLSTAATSPVIARSQPPTARGTHPARPAELQFRKYQWIYGYVARNFGRHGPPPGHRRRPDLCRATGYVIGWILIHVGNCVC